MPADLRADDRHRVGVADRAAMPPRSPVAARTGSRSPQGTFAWCPVCDGRLEPEHAHFRCTGCGWRDGCCD